MTSRSKKMQRRRVTCGGCRMMKQLGTGLLEWAAQMGRWEACVWRRLEMVVADLGQTGLKRRKS
jgi:hypothetical protein